MKIIKKEILAEAQGSKIIRLEILSPEIAARIAPGQFIVLMVSAEGERVPLTVVEKDIQQGTITLIFQEAGFTTRLLGKLEAGDSLYALAGPLGHATEIKNYGKVIVIGGGVGIAEIYPVAGALKEAGNYISCILGARTKSLLILEQELKKISDEIYITTDDGSDGRKGFVTDVLNELLTNAEPKNMHYALIYTVGPIPMMKKVAQVTGKFNTRAICSLNALMVDATGMCGCCRVDIAGEVKFSCVDGPEFDAHQVNWEELEKRNRVYLDKEKHICNLNNLF